MILTDTSFIIEYLRNQPHAVEFIKNRGKRNLAVNTVIAMELYQGARNKVEFQKIQKELSGFFMLPINETIAGLALQLGQKVRAYAQHRSVRHLYRGYCFDIWAGIADP